MESEWHLKRNGTGSTCEPKTKCQSAFKNRHPYAYNKLPSARGDVTAAVPSCGRLSPSARLASEIVRLLRHSLLVMVTKRTSILIASAWVSRAIVDYENITRPIAGGSFKISGTFPEDARRSPSPRRRRTSRRLKISRVASLFCFLRMRVVF